MFHLRSIAVTTAFAAALLAQRLDGELQGQEQPAGQPRPGAGMYSPEAVAKADKILEEVGLTRSGKTYRETGTANISRAITALSRQRRELRIFHQDWEQASERAVAIRKELKRLDLQQGEMHLQLAGVAGRDTAANNRIVGLIEATRTQMRALNDQEQKAKDDSF